MDSHCLAGELFGGATFRKERGFIGQEVGVLGALSNGGGQKRSLQQPAP